MTTRTMRGSAAVQDRRKDAVASKTVAITVEQFVYYAAISIYVCSTLWNRITFSSFYQDTVESILLAFDILAVALILSKLLLQGFSGFKELTIVGSLTLLGFVSWYITKTAAMFWLAVLIAAGKNTTLRGISRAIFFALLFSFLLALFGLGLEIVSDHLVIRNGVQRFALGFSHPNYLGVVCFSLILTFRLSGFTQSRALYVALCVILGWVVYYFADTRTGLFSILILMLFILAWPSIHNDRSLGLKRGIWALGILLLAYSLVTMVIYTPSNAILSFINNVMTGRLYCANHFFNIFPPNLLGRTVNDASVLTAGGWFSFMVDNAYCHLLIRYGVIPSVLLIFGFFAYFKSEARDPRCTLAFFLIPTAMIAGLSEATVLLVANNPLLLLLIPVVHSMPLSEFDNTEGSQAA